MFSRTSRAAMVRAGEAATRAADAMTMSTKRWALYSGGVRDAGRCMSTGGLRGQESGAPRRESRDHRGIEVNQCRCNHFLGEKPMRPRPRFSSQSLARLRMVYHLFHLGLDSGDVSWSVQESRCAWLNRVGDAVNTGCYCRNAHRCRLDD